MAYVTWENGLSVTECENILKQYENAEYECAEAGESDNREVRKTNILRNSSICWLHKDSLLVRALFQFIIEANDTSFRYNLLNYEQDKVYDTLQLTKYEEAGYYSWHQDSWDVGRNGFNRKLSLTVNLNNPKNYEGGDLEFFDGEASPHNPTKRTQGSVVVFDSYDWHRVTPVTKGIRYSLVMWVWGPDLK